MKARKELPRFPEIREAMSRAIARKKADTKLKMTDIIDELIKEANISRATFWNYRRGERVVPEENENALTEYFYLNRPEEAASFIHELKKAREKKSTAQRGAGNRLAEGQALRIDLTDYPPFSERIGRMVNHLCRLSDIKQERTERGLNFDMRQALWHNEIDLAVGYFANLYRAVHVHFWPTTIKIGLGAVVLREHGTKDEVKLIQDVLAGNQVGSRRLLYPVLVEREVGDIHCRQTLQYLKDEVVYVENMTAENLDANGVAEKLKQTQKRNPEKIAVAVLDEYSSFHVLKNLVSLGVPVLPLSSRQETRDAPRRELPASFLSIGCSREQPELRDVMSQSLNLFLATEVESNALNLASLHTQLLREVTAVVKDHYSKTEGRGAVPELLKRAEAEAFKAAYGWVLYVLGLDHQSIESTTGELPWGPIVKRARERALSRLADDEHKETIREVIKLEVGPEDVTPSEKKFSELCEVLDLRMRLSGVEREYVLEDRDILVRTIRDGLRGDAVGLPIEKGKEGGRVENLPPTVEPIPGEDLKKEADRKEKLREKIRVLDGYLRDLQEFYTKRIGDVETEQASSKQSHADSPDVIDSPQTRIKNFRSNLQEQYLSRTSATKSEKNRRQPAKTPRTASAKPFFGGHKDDRILLASFGKSPSRYMGSACLSPYRQNPKWLELFYLWIQPEYRQLAVGDRIIANAKQYALKNQYEFLVVTVLPTLNEAVTYFRKREFERRTVREDGRLILTAKPKSEEDD